MAPTPTMASKEKKTRENSKPKFRIFHLETQLHGVLWTLVPKLIYNLGRSRDKTRPSRFSDPRDTVRNTHLTHVNILAPNPSDFIMRIGVPSGLTMAINPSRPTVETQRPSSSASESSSSSEHRHKKSKKHKKSSRKKRKRDRSDSEDNDTNGQLASDRFSVASSARRSISRSTDLSSTRRSRSRSPRNHRRRDRSRDRRRDRSSRSRSRDSRRSYRQRSRSREKYRR
jgi:hypothetical protein